MKIDRLLGILVVLLNNERTTAPYLAEKFEVSRRTINRDIEDLCMAGIPVITQQGTGGGICIADGYKVDKTLITTKEMQEILAGLKSLDSISGDNQYDRFMDKMFPRKNSEEQDNIYDASGHIVINLASYYKESLAPKIKLLREAMDKHRVVEFDYYCHSGNTHRRIEPHLLVFEWSSWYIFGYCQERNGFRLFKLNRLLNLNIKEDTFVEREIPSFRMTARQMYQNSVSVVAEIAPSAKWKLIDEYGTPFFEELENGWSLFSYEFTDVDNAVEWLLRYGDKIRVIGSQEVKEAYQRVIANISDMYKE